MDIGKLSDNRLVKLFAGNFLVHPELRKNPHQLYRARILAAMLVAEISLYIVSLLMLVLAPDIRDASSFLIRICLCCIAVIAYSIYILKKHGNYRFCCLLTIGRGFLATVILTVLTGGTFDSAAGQMLSAPCLIAFFLGGIRWGVTTTALALLTVIVITAMQSLGIEFPQMTPANLLPYKQSLSLPINFGFIAVLSMIFEFTFLSVKRERDLEHQKFLELARIDPLTGLANRRIFDETLAARIELYSKLTPVRCFALCCLDLDKFKPINDQFGHDVGDEVLNVVSTRLRAALRGADFIGRHGGDEFLILLDTVHDTDAAAALAQRFLQLLQEPVDTSAGKMQVSGSFGFALFPEHGDDIISLQKAADDAMYEAKRSGRGFVMYSASAKSSVS